VYNEAWSKNWGFVPMTEAEVGFMAGRLKPLLTEGLTWIAETATEPVGFLLALPDFNEAIKPLGGRLLTPRRETVADNGVDQKLTRMQPISAHGVLKDEE
jgi:hypothetical protein